MDISCVAFTVLFSMGEGVESAPFCVFLWGTWIGIWVGVGDGCVRLGVLLLGIGGWSVSWMGSEGGGMGLLVFPREGWSTLESGLLPFRVCIDEWKDAAL